MHVVFWTSMAVDSAAIADATAHLVCVVVIPASRADLGCTDGVDDGCFEGFGWGW